MHCRRLSLFIAFSALTLISGQSASASPCNRNLWQQAALRCMGNQQCISNTYLGATNFNVKSFLQCKTEQWNRITGDNKTVDEIFGSKRSRIEPSSSKSMEERQGLSGDSSSATSETSAGEQALDKQEPQNSNRVGVSSYNGCVKPELSDPDRASKYQGYFDCLKNSMINR